MCVCRRERKGVEEGVYVCVRACVYAMHIIVLCVYARLSKMNTSVFPPPLPAWLPLLALSLLPAWYSPDTWASSCHGRHASPNSALLHPSPAPGQSLLLLRRVFSFVQQQQRQQLRQQQRFRGATTSPNGIGDDDLEPVS